MLLSIITSLHIFICVLLIFLVLLQQGKGADAGVTFGGGGNTVFGASGADNFITRFTTVLACCFMITSVYLGVQAKPGSPAEGRLFKGVADNAAGPIAASPVAAEAKSSSATATSSSATSSAANETSTLETSSTDTKTEQATSSTTDSPPSSSFASASAASSSVATAPITK